MGTARTILRGLLLLLLAAAVAPPSGAAGRSADSAEQPEARDAIAVVIGNRRYEHGLPQVRYAENDARAAVAFVREVLGYRAGNLIELIDASQAEMFAMFGNDADHRGKLWSWVKPGRSDVFVFYSGHGVPGLRDRRGYLLPVDADPATPEINGYPLDLLIANLAKLEARSTVVLVDACFSGDSAGGRLIDSASPVYVSAEPASATGDIVLVTAARGTQLASWDHEARHGLFTRHVLEALGGRADEAVGDGDGRVTLKEVRAYLDDEMTYAARRSYRRVQEASVSGDPDSVLVAGLPEGGWSPPVPRSDAAPVSAAPSATARGAASVLAPVPGDVPAHSTDVFGRFNVPGEDPAAVQAFLTRHAGDVRQAILAYDHATDPDAAAAPIAELAWLRILRTAATDFDLFVQLQRDGTGSGTASDPVTYATFRVEVTPRALRVTEMWR